MIVTPIWTNYVANTQGYTRGSPRENKMIVDNKLNSSQHHEKKEAILTERVR